MKNHKLLTPCLIIVFSCSLYSQFALAQVVNNSNIIGNAIKKPKTIKTCFFLSSDIKCSLRSDLDEETIGASRPASLAYTKNYDGNDSFSISSAFKAQFNIASSTVNFKTLWQKNNQTKKEQDNLLIGLGLHFEPSNVEKVFDAWLLDNSKSKDIWTLYTDLDTSYGRKAVYADKTNIKCIANPNQKACQTQYLETSRFQITSFPFISSFEKNADSANPALYYSFSPRLGVFLDQALNNNVETLSGSKIDGNVSGGFIGFGLTISPSAFNNKWALNFNAQKIETFKRDFNRETDFPKESSIFSTSINYALSNNFIGQSGDGVWLPVVSLTYTNGGDALKGRANQKTLALSFALKY